MEIHQEIYAVVLLMIVSKIKGTRFDKFDHKFLFYVVYKVINYILLYILLMPKSVFMNQNFFIDCFHLHIVFTLHAKGTFYFSRCY